jgi:hypothetical protein
MGSFISIIPTEGVGFCIVSSILILTFIVLFLKFFNFKDAILKPKKKADFFKILKDAAKSYSDTNDEKSYVF